MSDKIWNPKLALDKFYPDIRVEFEEELQLVWLYMKANPRQCFTLDMLQSLKLCVSEIKRYQGCGIKYIVLASDVPGVFNLGGDLNLFYKYIINNNREGLLKYGTLCVDSQYESMIHLGLDLTTISLVQGDALGGGFEGALSTNLFIAEKGSLVGFPEILFNLFPGMGAYNFLSARIGPFEAEKLILSGQRYPIEHFSGSNLVDIVVDKGHGQKAVYDYIKRADRSPAGYAAMRFIRDRYNNISYSDLIQIVELWSDTALSLRKRDLRMMKRLIDKQTR